mgnify:CR=1 FL=1
MDACTSGLGPGLGPTQVQDDRPRQARPHDSRQLVEGGGANALDAAEVPEQPLTSRGADPGPGTPVTG